MRNFYCFCLVASLLIGCGGNVKNYACSGQNWAEFGYKMGVDGRSVHEFDAHRSSCGSNLEDGAVKQYLDGYMRGIIEFCTFDRGYAMGSNGVPISEYCPLEIRKSYVKGYQLGKIDRGEKVKKLEKSTEELERPRPVAPAGPEQ